MTTITTTILSRKAGAITAQLTRPAGFTLPAVAVEGLLKAEVAKALGTTPKALRWVAVPGLKTVTPSEITMTFEPTGFVEQPDGTVTFRLPERLLSSEQRAGR